MKYNNHMNYRDRKRYLFRIRLFFVCFTLGLIGLVSYMILSLETDNASNTSQITTSESSSGYFAPSVKIFRTPYFQFQADQTWAEVSGESTTNKFVYRSLRSNLIEHEMVVYVNQIPANLESNRVLATSVKAGDTELEAGTVSDHCLKTLPGGSRAQAVAATVDSVKMSCDADSTNYTVMAGLKGGSTTLNLKRPDKTAAAYAIYYTNLKAVPDGAQIAQIMSTFQTR